MNGQQPFLTTSPPPPPPPPPRIHTLPHTHPFSFSVFPPCVLWARLSQFSPLQKGGGKKKHQMFSAVSNEVVDLIRAQSPAIFGFCSVSMVRLALKNWKATFFWERARERERWQERHTHNPDFFLLLLFISFLNYRHGTWDMHRRDVRPCFFVNLTFLHLLWKFCFHLSAGESSLLTECRVNPSLG